MTDDTPPTVLGRKTGTNTHEARLEIIKNWPVPVQSGCDCPRCTALERLAAPTAEFVCEVTHALSDEEAAMSAEDLTARKAEDLAAALSAAVFFAAYLGMPKDEILAAVADGALRHMKFKAATEGPAKEGSVH